MGFKNFPQHCKWLQKCHIKKCSTARCWILTQQLGSDVPLLHLTLFRIFFLLLLGHVETAFSQSHQQRACDRYKVRQDQGVLWYFFFFLNYGQSLYCPKYFWYWFLLSSTSQQTPPSPRDDRWQPTQACCSLNKRTNKTGLCAPRWERDCSVRRRQVDTPTGMRGTHRSDRKNQLLLGRRLRGRKAAVWPAGECCAKKPRSLSPTWPLPTLLTLCVGRKTGSLFKPTPLL